jgi:hypothetical protein
VIICSRFLPRKPTQRPVSPPGLLRRSRPQNRGRKQNSFDRTFLPSAISYGIFALMGRDDAMPINRLFRGGKIKPEEVERLNRAFTFTLYRLNLVDRNDPVCISSLARFSR